MPLPDGALLKPCAPGRAADNALLILLIRDRRAELTVESVIGLVAGDFQSPMCKILGGVAVVAPALEHEKVFGSGNDSGLEKARPVNLSFKTPFFIK